MTKIILTLFAFALVGCTTPLSVEPNKSFQFEDQNWNLYLPEDWTTLNPTEEVVFMAQNQDQNIAILKRKMIGSSLKEQIMQSAEKDFFDLQVLDENESQWSFEGQVRANLPMRVFEQKYYSLNDKVLLASCSYEKAKTNKSDCTKILNSWVMELNEA